MADIIQMTFFHRVTSHKTGYNFGMIEDLVDRLIVDLAAGFDLGVIDDLVNCLIVSLPVGGFSHRFRN